MAPREANTALLVLVVMASLAELEAMASPVVVVD